VSIATLCEALDVSESGYYAWRKHQPSAHEQEDERLGQLIETIFHSSRQTYGSDRIHAALRQQGVYTARKRVARLMRERGLQSVRVQQTQRRSLTRSVSNPYIVANLLNQDFTTTQPNHVWVTDTTYVPTLEGWLYLVTVLDLGTRLIVGWAMGRHHDAELACDALEMAIQHQRPAAGLMLHSDRGSEFANARYHGLASNAQMQRSMSRSGNCFDNAVAESFFATLKLEAVRGTPYPSRQAARMHLFDYIEAFYNRQRLHSSLGYQTPNSVGAHSALLPQGIGSFQRVTKAYNRLKFCFKNQIRYQYSPCEPMP
jgi:putative transposase